VSGPPAAAQAVDPCLSVVLATNDGYATIRRTVGHLARQTIAGAIELVLVGPDEIALDDPDPALARFLRVRRVAAPMPSIGAANAAGAFAATAPVVAFAEDHAFPEPEWAAALLDAHRGPYAAVAPVVVNANPASAASRADLWIGYGPWLAPAAAGERPYLPGHNTSYKRAALVAWGADLPGLLDSETLLHWRMRDAGAKLWLEPKARVAHTNFSRWRSWLPAMFHSGHLFAGMRARGMPLARRAVYVLGAPLIAPLRWWRCLREARARGKLGEFAGCAPALAIGLACDAAGQLVGYAIGPGLARTRLARYEFHRFRHLRRDEQARFGPP
jgi:hypothetical protein